MFVRFKGYSYLLQIKKIYGNKIEPKAPLSFLNESFLQAKFLYLNGFIID